MNPATNDSLARYCECPLAHEGPCVLQETDDQDDDASRTRKDTLARAIDSLGAVRVAPGYYAYRTGPHFVTVNREAMIDLADYDPQDARTFAHEQGYETAMPSWWSPEQRTTERCIHGRLAAQACSHNECGKGWNEQPWQRITADLETGEEVPA